MASGQFVRTETLKLLVSGGGLVLFINNKWCNPGHATVKEQICNKDIELLAVSLRPYYWLREWLWSRLWSPLLFKFLHLSTRKQPVTYCMLLLRDYKLIIIHSFIFISGDFIHTSLSSTLPTFKQYVDCTTRENKTLDLLYANIKDVYKCSALPPLGGSDHRLTHLSPTYIPVVKRMLV